MAGPNENQKGEVRALIAEAIATSLQAASQEAQKSIEQTVGLEVEKLREAGRSFEGRIDAQKQQQETIISQIADSQRTMGSMVVGLRQSGETSRGDMQQLLDSMTQLFAQIQEQLTTYDATKNNIIADMEGRRQTMEALTATVQQGIMDASGACKGELMASLQKASQAFVRLQEEFKALDQRVSHGGAGTGPVAAAAAAASWAAKMSRFSCSVASICFWRFAASFRSRSSRFQTGSFDVGAVC